MQHAVVCGVLSAEVLPSGERPRTPEPQTASQQGRTARRKRRRSRYCKVHPSDAHVARVRFLFPPIKAPAQDRYRDNHETAIKCASASCKLGSTDRRKIVAASSSGVHGGAFLSLSSRFRHIFSTRSYGLYSSTRVLDSTMSHATRTGLIVARLYRPSPWMMSSPTW